jgi:hypothetical protein
LPHGISRFQPDFLSALGHIARPFENIVELPSRVRLKWRAFCNRADIDREGLHHFAVFLILQEASFCL